MACSEVIHGTEVFMIDDGDWLCVVIDARRRRRNRLLNRLDPLVDRTANVVDADLSMDTRIPAVLNFNLTTIVVPQNPPLAAVVSLENRARNHVGKENFITLDWRQRIGQEEIARVRSKLSKRRSAEIIGIADHLLEFWIAVRQVLLTQDTGGLADRIC